MKKREKAPIAADEEAGSASIHVGRKIAILRAASDLTQSDLARSSRVKRSSISEYEAGLTTPDSSTLARLLAGMRFQWSSLDLAGWFLRRLFSGCAAPDEATSTTADAAVLENMAAEMREMAARLDATAQAVRASGPKVSAQGGE